MVLLGDPTVGKTTILLLAKSGNFSNDAIPTHGAVFHINKTSHNDIPLKLHIWNTAGQER
jgi:GTPase SAR1 family protein